MEKLSLPSYVGLSKRDKFLHGKKTNSDRYREKSKVTTRLNKKWINELIQKKSFDVYFCQLWEIFTNKNGATFIINFSNRAIIESRNKKDTA